MGWFRKVGSLAKSVVTGYRDDDCHQFAAVISFYAIFSLVPLAMIIVAVLAYVIGYSSGLVERFEFLLQSIIPAAASDLTQMMYAALQKKQSVSLVSIAILIINSTFMVSALERSMDRVFRIEKKRNFFHSKIIAIGFLFVSILLFAAPGVVQLVQASLVETKVMSRADILPLSGDVFFFFIAFCIFLFSTVVIPNRKVYLRYAFLGSIAFTTLTGVARLIFREYIVASWDRYDVIYGSLTVIIVLMVWIYYMATIFLVCAEFVARLQENRKT